MSALRSSPRCASRGFNLIEVLVALLIVMVGLLGLAGMQARAQVGELESYQRAQALVLLYDMVDRITNNKLTAPCFAVSSAAGTGFLGDSSQAGHAAAPACSESSPANNALAVASLNAWDALLKGSSETKGVAQVGAMIGARGCVSYNAATEYLDASTSSAIPGTGEYTIAVSWQGMADTFAPTKACGAGLYGTSAASDTKRRTVWATMRVGTLAAR